MVVGVLRPEEQNKKTSVWFGLSSTFSGLVAGCGCALYIRSFCGVWKRSAREESEGGVWGGGDRGGMASLCIA